MKTKKLITIASAALLAASAAGCSSPSSADTAAPAKTELELVSTLDQAILSLSTGKCDAVALDGTTAQNYVDQSGGQFAMSGVNFDLTIYGDFEGNVVIAKKGESSLIAAVNECINTCLSNDYYTKFTAIAKKQAGTEDDAANEIIGDLNVFPDVTIDETYDYLLAPTLELIGADALEMPALDLSGADGVLQKILDKGSMVIATSPDYPANEFIMEDGTLYGCELALAKYVADSLGVDLVIETMDFNAVLTAVDTGKVDIAFSGFGWKADRAEAFELSVGYSGDDDITFHTLIVPAGQEGNYNSLEDFVGKHIMAQASSLQQMYVEDQIIALEN